MGDIGGDKFGDFDEEIDLLSFAKDTQDSLKVVVTIGLILELKAESILAGSGSSSTIISFWRF